MSYQHHADEGFHEYHEVFKLEEESEVDDSNAQNKEEQVAVEPVVVEEEISPARKEIREFVFTPKTTGHWGFGQTTGII